MPSALACPGRKARRGNLFPTHRNLTYRNRFNTEEGFVHLLWWIIVGLIAGWATGKIMRGAGFGPLMDIVIGIIGAVIGGWIMRALGFASQGSMIYTIIVAIIGAVILTAIVRLITGKGKGTGASGLKRAA
jgi:uncharacterized membrane protein YeaQ/YmgE (transglycosylase-associated protein family)